MGAEIIVTLLERAGIRMVSGIPGGANLPLYDALHKSRIRHILARHEQGAGFIAHGIARSTGSPAVCLATSGPGATNLVTAIADAKLDSVPLIAITGQVATSMIGTDAFQEVDTYGMTLPITKHNFLVKNAAELLTIIPRAFAIAVSGRPGPVLIDVPKDVQTETVEVTEWPAFHAPLPPPAIDPAAVQKAGRMLHDAKRPVIYAGGGIAASGCHEQLLRLSRRNAIPVALTLMGLGCFPPDDPLYLGMLGMHGTPAANIVLDEADLLLALGVRFDDRAIGMAKAFCPRAAVIHVDIDEAELHKIRRADLSIAGDVGRLIDGLLETAGIDGRPKWTQRVSRLKSMAPETTGRRNGDDHPLEIIRAIASMMPPDTIVCTDVGQHQMWVAQAYPFSAPRTLLTSGGLGTMGFGLPAAIGAALAHPGRRVLCISGDGSLQMNIQELATLSELGLDVTILVMNNRHLGLVRQQQELFYQENYIASRFEIDLDFAAVARQFGITGYRLDGRALESGTLKSGALKSGALAGVLDCKGPTLLDICIDHMDNVFPMVPPGAPTTEMLYDRGKMVRAAEE
jgi:acetolactate synthase-1/2/3 large subunit